MDNNPLEEMTRRLQDQMLDMGVTSIDQNGAPVIGDQPVAPTSSFLLAPEGGWVSTGVIPVRREEPNDG